MGDFDLAAYLDRVGLPVPPPQTAAGLATVQWAQLCSVPFENFDILMGRGVDVAPAAIFAKLVSNRRGGYCFENNQLFGAALRSLGFDARPVLARVLYGQDGPLPAERVMPLTHLFQLVTIEGTPYMADVGFGSASLRAPLALDDGHEAALRGRRYRVRADPRFGWRLQGHDGEDWRNHYAFGLATVFPADVALGNHWTATAPASHFTRAPSVSLMREAGPITLRGSTVTRWTGTVPQASELASAEELVALLAEEWHLDLQASPAELARVWDTMR